MSLSAYSKTTWVNGGTPAINQTNLNKIETGIDDVTEDVLTASTIGDTTVTAEVTSLASTVLEAPFSTAYLRGRTVANMLGTAGDFEATTGWSGTNATIATDTNHEIFTSNALKITLTDVAGTVDFDVFSRLKTGSYYFLSAYIKNGNATNINLEFETDDADVVTADVTATTYNRVGLVVQPSDFNTASTALFRFNVTGTATQYAYVEGAMMIEITSAEYALGATALLAKYPYHSDIKGSDKMRVLSVGKNLFDEVMINGEYIDTDGITISSSATRSYSPNFIRIESSTIYYLKHVGGATYMKIFWYDTNKNYISDYEGAVKEFQITSPSNAKYIRITLITAGGDYVKETYQMQLESNATATPYEPYKSTSAIVDTVGNSVSDTIFEKVDLLTGRKEKNVSDVVTLNGNDNDWVFQGDYTGWKYFRCAISGLTTTGRVFKYNNKELSSGITAGDKYLLDSGYIYVSVNDTDTGWDEAWVSGTSFTGMTWGGLIKAYMNGWKLTTADTDVANCVWTGIASGTVENSGAASYTTVTTTIDTGFQPYRMYYQLAEPIITNGYPNVFESYPSGTIMVLPQIEDKGIYGTNLAITDTDFPISSLVKVWKVNTDDTKTPIAISDCTVVAGGLTFTVSGATAGEYYKYIYNYVGLSSTPSLTYDTADSTRAVEDNLCTAVANLDEKIKMVKDTDKRSWENIIDTVVSVDAAQVDLAVPSGYKYLELVISQFVGLGNISNLTDLYVRFNDDSGSKYYSGGGAATSFTVTLGAYDSATASAILNIINSTTHRKQVVYSGFRDDGGGLSSYHASYDSTDEIATINLISSQGSTYKIPANTRILLWGVK